MADTVTIESALEELKQASSGVEDAQKTLEAAQTAKEEKVEKIKSLMDELKAKAEELGLEAVQSVEEAKEAAQQKLDDAKAEWALEAAESPNAARRELRLVWGVIGAVAGALLGFAAGCAYMLLT